MHVVQQRSFVDEDTVIPKSAEVIVCASRNALENVERNEPDVHGQNYPHRCLQTLERKPRRERAEMKCLARLRNIIKSLSAKTGRQQKLTRLVVAYDRKCDVGVRSIVGGERVKHAWHYSFVEVNEGSRRERAFFGLQLLPILLNEPCVCKVSVTGALAAMNRLRCLTQALEGQVGLAEQGLLLENHKQRPRMISYEAGQRLGKVHYEDESSGMEVAVVAKCWRLHLDRVFGVNFPGPT